MRDPGSIRRIPANPNLAFGKAGMDGALVPVGCSVCNVLDLPLANIRRERHASPNADCPRAGAVLLLRDDITGPERVVAGMTQAA